MRFLKLLFFVSPLFFIYGCSTTIHYKIKPTAIEKTNIESSVSKIPYTAIVNIDSKATTSYAQYDSDSLMSVNIEYEFPTGIFLEQAARYYLPHYFQKVYFYNNELELLPVNNVILSPKIYYTQLKIQSGFSKRTATVFVKINTHLYHDYLISFPIDQAAQSSIEQTGVLKDFNNKDLAGVTASAITKSLIDSIPNISNELQNPNQSVLKAKSEIEKNPTDIQLYVILANAALLSGDTKDAIAASKMLIQLKSPYGYDLLAKSYYQSGQITLAKATYKEAIQKQVPNALQNYLLFLVNTSDIDGIKYYFSSLQNKPININMKTAVYLELLKKNYQNVINILEAQIKKYKYKGIGLYFENYLSNDDYPIVRDVNPTAIASNYIKSGDIIVELNGSSTKNFDFNKLKFDKADVNDIVIKDGNQTKQLKLSKEEIIPVEASVYVAYLAFVYYLNNNYKNFEKNAEFAYKLNNKSNASICAKALYFIQKQQYQEAIEILDNADNVEFAKLLKAVALAKQNRQDQAINTYTSIKESDPLLYAFKPVFIESITPFVQNRLQIAKNNAENGDYKKALYYYASVLNFTPNLNEIFDSVSQIIEKNPSLVELNEEDKKRLIFAQMYFEENKLDKAIYEINTLVLKYPFNPKLHYDLALLLAQAQNYSQAIKHMNTYLALVPNTPNKEAVQNEMYKWEFKLKEN